MHKFLFIRRGKSIINEKKIHKLKSRQTNSAHPDSSIYANAFFERII